MPLPFEDHADRYNNLATALMENPDFLAAIDYSAHFVARSTAWKNGDTKNFHTIFFPISTNPQSKEDMPQELTVSLVGEVAAEGCELSACRNAWLRPNQKITNHMAVKDVLVLKIPTMSTGPLAILYENQIRTLEDLCENIILPVPTVRLATAFPSPSLIFSPRPTRSPTALPKWMTGPL